MLSSSAFNNSTNLEIAGISADTGFMYTPASSLLMVGFIECISSPIEQTKGASWIGAIMAKWPVLTRFNPIVNDVVRTSIFGAPKLFRVKYSISICSYFCCRCREPREMF